MNGIKCETEAEGLSKDDIWFLKTQSLIHNVPLYVKIGGCEALNDILMCYDVNVDGIIAPMIESKFATFKFLNSVKKVYNNKKVKLVLNIESKVALDNLSDILEYSSSEISYINIGRTDLSLSYFNNLITPNSEFIFQKIKDTILLCIKYNVKISIGGGVNIQTLQKIQNDEFLYSNIFQIETRNIIFNTNCTPDIFATIKDLEIGFINHRLDMLSKLHIQNTDRINIIHGRI